MENKQDKNKKTQEQKTAFEELYGKDTKGGVEKGSSDNKPEGAGDFGGAAASPGASDQPEKKGTDA